MLKNPILLNCNNMWWYVREFKVGYIWQLFSVIEQTLQDTILVSSIHMFLMRKILGYWVCKLHKSLTDARESKRGRWAICARLQYAFFWIPSPLTLFVVDLVAEWWRGNASIHIANELQTQVLQLFRPFLQFICVSNLE